MATSSRRRSLDPAVLPFVDPKYFLEPTSDDEEVPLTSLPRYDEHHTDPSSELPSWHTTPKRRDRAVTSPALQRLADTRWLPTRRLWRLVGRRPLLFLIAFGTTIITLGTFILSHGGDLDVDWGELVEPLFFDLSPVTAPADGPLPMKSVNAFTPDCLEAWVARGEICTSVQGLDVLRTGARDLIPIDAVWTWVNGSDDRHISERAFWLGKPVDQSTYVPKPSPTPTPDAISQTLQLRDEEPKSEAKESLWRRLLRRAPPRRPLAKARPVEKWFRDHDELKYSVRSVRAHVASIRRSIILATDFSLPYKKPASTKRVVEQGVYSDVLRGTDGDNRQGQWPQWLDPHSPWTRKDGEELPSGGISVYHHWDFFRPPRTETDADAWKNRVLPTFNSFAIESQIPNLPDLSEVFIYSNDDFFVGRDLTTADFYTPIFGNVYRFQDDLLVTPAENSRDDPSGEWPQLHRSNWILSERFGSRKRPYVVHATKTFNYPLFHESTLMFEDAYALTSSHRFRGLGHDIVTIYLVAYMNIERHREALLWSYFMAKMDRDGDGYFDADERMAIMEELTSGKGVTWDGENAKVILPKRQTLNKNQSSVDSVLDAVDFPRKKETTYSFSSQDGYPLFATKSYGYIKTFGKTWPDFYRAEDHKDTDACSMTLSNCFPEGFNAEPSEFTNAGMVMKRFAFDKLECGDCLVTHLVGRSGKRGLSAFLPTEDLFFPDISTLDSIEERDVDPDADLATDSEDSDSDSAEIIVPPPPMAEDRAAAASTSGPFAVLPVTESGSWRDIDYSLPYVQSTTNWPSSKSRREFAIQLIQRYSYVLGDSPVEFVSLRSNRQAQSDLNMLRRVNPAFACINDDIIKGQSGVDGMFSSWLHDTFPDKLPYEL